MGTTAQYILSISLFIGIPVGVQYGLAKLSARRAQRAAEQALVSDQASPVPIAVSAASD